MTIKDYRAVHLLRKRFKKHQFFNAAKDGDLDTLIKCMNKKKGNIQFDTIKDVTTSTQTIHNNNGYTALHYATIYNRMNIINYMLITNYKRYPYNVNVQDKQGYTPLHYASKLGYIDVVKCLIQAGKADITIPCIAGGRTPLHLACSYGHLNILQYYIDQCSMNPELPNQYSFTPLHYAVIAGEISIIQYLTQTCHVNVNVQTTTDEYTPLHFACQSGRLKIVRYLMEKCPATNIFMKTIQGNTILHIASEFDYITIAQYIVEHQSRTSTWKNGNRPLDTVCKSLDDNDSGSANKTTSTNDDDNMQDMLYCKNFINDTPYDIAIRKKHTELAKYLKEAMMNRQ